MLELLNFDIDLEKRARLLAAEIQPKTTTIRRREVKRFAGRLAETMLRNGAERWQSVLVEDSFIQRVHERLAEIDRAAKSYTVSRNVVTLRQEVAAA